MKIPKGTLKQIVRRTHRLFFGHYGRWFVAASPFLVVLLISWLAFLNNPKIIWWFNDHARVWFDWADMGVTFVLGVVLVLSLIAVLFVFDAVEKGQPVPPPVRLYAKAFDALGPWVVLKLRYLGHIALKTLLLVIPGVLTLADECAAGFAYLLDAKEGKEAFELSRRTVRLNRSRYWDYLLISFLLAWCVVYPFILLMDSIYTVFTMHTSFIGSSLSRYLSFVMVYHGMVYMMVFHHQIYRTFKQLRADSGA